MRRASARRAGVHGALRGAPRETANPGEPGDAKPRALPAAAQVVAGSRAAERDPSAWAIASPVPMILFASRCGSGAKMSLQYDYEQPGFLLYEELEVSPRASDPVIRAAYGRLMRVHVADPNKVDRLRRAFDVLSNPTNRTAYDAMGIEGRPAKQEVRYLRAGDKATTAGGAAAGASALMRAGQTGLIVALSVVSGLVGGFEIMRLLAERGTLPFG